MFELPTLKAEFQKKDTKDIAVILIQKEYDLYIKCKVTYKLNKMCMYTVVYGQCSKAMRAKLESNN
eukprot:9310876-Ditylum_brightwellii.AAC.1